MPNLPKPPALAPAAARLLYLCLGIIGAWLLIAALYAGGALDGLFADAVSAAARRQNAFELLRGAYIASVLAYGGAFLLDLEVRHAKRK